VSDEVTGIDATSPSRNGHGSDTWCQPWRHLRIEHSGAGHCRVTFDHPPSNAVTATTLAELDELLGLIEQDPDLKVVVFASANPDVFLAHGEEEQPASMAAWRDLLARLSRARVVTIAALRGGVHGAGSEFALACDLQFRLRD
jgi:enoyl-CoA hydratase/carnithine racemase